MKERNEMKCDVIYRCVSFIIDYQYFSGSCVQIVCNELLCVKKKPLQIYL